MTRNTHNGKRNTNGIHVLDGMPQTIAHGAEEGAGKIAGRSRQRCANGQGRSRHVAKGAGQASGIASELSGQLKGEWPRHRSRVKDAKLNMKDAKLSLREKRLRMMETLMRATMKRQAKLLPSTTDAMVKAQLVKTSRELAHESSDLNAAVSSLNKIIRANRRAAAKSRTRLLGGAALGAALMYHFDAERGRERRAATAQLVTTDGPRPAPAASRALICSTVRRRVRLGVDGQCPLVRGWAAPARRAASRAGSRA